ncbi:MAG: hypothetical protein K6E58_03170 [Eubacterium sp.]|nr:hypothetical protein [Eubacterium sp.]
MKKLLFGLLILFIGAASFFANPKKVEAKSFKVKLKSEMKAINVSWKKQKNATKYVVYKRNLNYEDSVPYKNTFKKVKTVKNNKYKDKKVSKGQYYVYYVDAINSKGKVIKTTYNKKGKLNYRCCGYDRPTLYNAGYGKEYTNDPYHIYLQIKKGTHGVKYKRAEIEFYRLKYYGNEKYKKVKAKKLTSKFWVDDTVEAGAPYDYKARICIKKGKKKAYSAYSDFVLIRAQATKAFYEVKPLTDAGIYNAKELEVVFKINNLTRFSGTAALYSHTGNYLVTNKDLQKETYKIQFTQARIDGENWINLGNVSSYSIPDNKPIYLKAIIKSNGKDYIMFGGDDKENYIQSEVSDYFKVYWSCGGGTVNSHCDLLNNSLWIHETWR